MEYLYIFLLSVFYLANSRVYIKVYERILVKKYQNIVIYNVLWILFGMIIIVKQFSGMILKNSSFELAMVMVMILFQFVLVFLCYIGNVKEKLFTVCIPFSASILLDILAILIGVCIFKIPANESKLTLGTVLITGIESCLTILAYSLYVRILKNITKQGEDVHEFTEIFIMSLVDLIIVVPTLIIFNGLAVNKNSLEVIAVIQFIVIVLMFLLCRNIVKKKNIIEINNIKLLNEYKYYDNIIEKTEELQKLRHDMNNHFGTLRTLLELGEMDKLKEYLNKICDDIESSREICLLQDSMLSIIITEKIKKAHHEGVRLQRLFLVSDGFEKLMKSMEDIDKTALFANILDNAIRAAGETERKKIEFMIQEQDDIINITCINTCLPKKIQSTSYGLRSTKKGYGHGYGMKIIQSVVARYGGVVYYKIIGEEFTLNISFRKEKKGVIT